MNVVSEKLIANQEEKIEAFRSRGVIRITAPKEKSDIIVQEIRNVLQNTRCLKVDLNVLLPGRYDRKTKAAKTAGEIYGDSLIHELSRLTETQILRLPNNQVSTRVLTMVVVLLTLTVACYLLYKPKA